MTKRDGIINILNFAVNQEKFLSSRKNMTEKQQKAISLYFRIQDKYYDILELNKPADCFKKVMKQKFYQDREAMKQNSYQKFGMFMFLLKLKINLFASGWSALLREIENGTFESFWKEFLSITGEGQNISREKQFSVLRNRFLGQNLQLI